MDIDIKLGSKYVSPWTKEMICMVLIIAKSVLENWGLVHGIMTWSVGDGGEDT